MSQASMNKLAEDMLSLNRRIPLEANRLKQDAAMLLENNLTQTTPIDTGAAISNWVATINVPFDGLLDPYAPSHLGTHNHPEHGDISGAAFNAQGAMDAARVIVATAQPGQTIFISNNDPAIDETNSGRTRTIPPNSGPGYVESSITASMDVMSRATFKP